MYDKNFTISHILQAFCQSPSRRFQEAAADASTIQQPSNRELDIGYSILNLSLQQYTDRRLRRACRAFQKPTDAPNPELFFWGQKQPPTAGQERFGQWTVIRGCYSPPPAYTKWLLEQGYWLAFGMLKYSQVPSPRMASKDCAAIAFLRVGCSPKIPEYLKPYYLTAVKHEALNHIKATRINSSPSKEEGTSILTIPTENESIEDQLDKPVRQQIIQAVFQDLGLRDQRIIALRSIEELSYAEIAEALELYNKHGALNTSLVGRRLNNFKKRLKERYQQLVAREQAFRNSTA